MSSVASSIASASMPTSPASAQRRLSAGSGTSSLDSVTNDVFACYANFELSTRTQLRLDGNGRSPSTNRRPNHPAAPTPSAATPRSPVPQRSILFRCVWHFWDISLVKPLQLIAATLGIVVGIVAVAAEATAAVLWNMVQTLGGTFMAAFEYVHGAPNKRPRLKKARQHDDETSIPPTPLTLPSPDRGGRTPSSAPSQHSLSVPATPSALLSMSLDAFETHASPHSPKSAHSPSSQPSGVPVSAADGIECKLPDGRLMRLPDAICVDCGEVVAPGQACAHLAQEAQHQP